MNIKTFALIVQEALEDCMYLNSADWEATCEKVCLKHDQDKRYGRFMYLALFTWPNDCDAWAKDVLEN